MVKTDRAGGKAPKRRLPISMSGIPKLKDPSGLFVLDSEDKTIAFGKFINEASDTVGEKAVLAEVHDITKEERRDMAYLVINLDNEIFKRREGRLLIVKFRSEY